MCSTCAAIVTVYGRAGGLHRQWPGEPVAVQSHRGNGAADAADRAGCFLHRRSGCGRRRVAGLPLSGSMPQSAADPAFREIACDQVIAQVFTSGSTGCRTPHVKRWGSLVRNVQAEARVSVSSAPCPRGHGAGAAHVWSGNHGADAAAMRCGAACRQAVLSGRHLRGAGTLAPAAGAGDLALSPARAAG